MPVVPATAINSSCYPWLLESVVQKEVSRLSAALCIPSTWLLERVVKQKHQEISHLSAAFCIFSHLLPILHRGTTAAVRVRTYSYNSSSATASGLEQYSHLVPPNHTNHTIPSPKKLSRETVEELDAQGHSHGWIGTRYEVRVLLPPMMVDRAAQVSPITSVFCYL